MDFAHYCNTLQNFAKILHTLHMALVVYIHFPEGLV